MIILIKSQGSKKVMESLPSKINDKLKTLPDQPGVYLMTDANDVIIYVGKAKSLKKRVSSYFQKSDHDAKTAALVRQIDTFNYIVTDSEIEALLLEDSLIKKHLPKYNIRLKDDKRYPYIVVTTSAEYPRILYTRSFRANGDRYFGPYTDSFSARNTVELVNRIFHLRTCSRPAPLRNGERPCLNFQMKRCSGVCEGTVSREEYMTIVENVILFLEGNIDPVIQNLKKKMDQYSSEFRYERASEMRDMIFSIQRITEKQKVHTPAGFDQDYIGASIRGDEAIAILFEFRSGVLLGRKVSVFQNARYVSISETIRRFILEYYLRADIPVKIITEHEIEDCAIIADHLTSHSGHKVALAVSKSDSDKGILSLIHKNIDVLFAEKEALPADYALTLENLQKALSLENFPETICCFDISNIQGEFPVASMSFLTGGVPDKKRYRLFNIRGYDGANDPGMIHEAVSRYLTNCVNEEWDLADLILIDGGITQLTRAIEARDAIGVDVPVISIAKKFEEIYVDPKMEPFRFEKSFAPLKILQVARDEAHRFGITAHRKRRNAATLHSELDTITGIGSKKRTALLTHFGSVEGVKKAALEDLLSVKGINKNDAEKVIQFFSNSGQNESPSDITTPQLP